MARTLSELRTLMTEFMVLDLDNSKGESPSSANQNEQLNWAYRTLCSRASLFDPTITFTLVADQALYDIRDITTPVVSKKVIRPFRIYINNIPLRTADKCRPGLWTLEELEDGYSTWRSAGSGTPYAAILENYNDLRLHPKPSSTVVSGGNNYIAGIYMPADMSGDGAVPDLPEEFHELIAYMAAIKASLPIVTEDEMWNRIKAYDAEIQSAFRTFEREQARRLVDWGTIGANNQGDYLIV